MSEETNMRAFTNKDATEIRRLLVPKHHRRRLDVGLRETEHEDDWDADMRNWKRLDNGEHVDLCDIWNIQDLTTRKTGKKVVCKGTSLDLYVYVWDQGSGDWDLWTNEEVIWNGSEWIVGDYSQWRTK